MTKSPRARKAPSRSYVRMRPQQIAERGPSIGRCNGHTVYEWIKIAGRPSGSSTFSSTKAMLETRRTRPWGRR